MSHSVDEAYDVYLEQRVTARKQHECDCVFCFDPIRPGDAYWRVSTVFDGTAETIKRCIRCQLLHEHLRGLCESGEQWPDERLNCGLTYESEWGPVPPVIAALAFWRPGDPLPALNECTSRSTCGNCRSHRQASPAGYGARSCVSWNARLTGSGTEVCS